jgi:hypothetical protein
MVVEAYGGRVHTPDADKTAADQTRAFAAFLSKNKSCATALDVRVNGTRVTYDLWYNNTLVAALPVALAQLGSALYRTAAGTKPSAATNDRTVDFTPDNMADREDTAATSTKSSFDSFEITFDNLPLAEGERSTNIAGSLAFASTTSLYISFGFVPIAALACVFVVKEREIKVREGETTETCE